ncbi:unnamed protein product [Calypogeia fissa]
MASTPRTATSSNNIRSAIQPTKKHPAAFLYVEERAASIVDTYDERRRSPESERNEFSEFSNLLTRRTLFRRLDRR